MLKMLKAKESNNTPSSLSFHITEENIKLLEKGLQQRNKSNFEESDILTL